ncbi:MAG: hypothetical protein O3A25_16120 [Acidobacteria bacterium]|nr:hypothetical protein [Acidobacteriota bacterium]
MLAVSAARFVATRVAYGDNWALDLDEDGVLTVLRSGPRGDTALAPDARLNCLIVVGMTGNRSVRYYYWPSTLELGAAP